MDAGLPEKLWQMVWAMPWRWAVNNKRLNGEVLQLCWRRRRGIPTTNTGGWGELVRWITWFVRLCWFDGTHRRWINRYMLCNSEESYSLQVLIVSWDVGGQDFWIPEVLKQWQTTSMSSGVCFGRIRILAIFDSALLCCTTGNDMEWLYLLWQPKILATL